MVKRISSLPPTPPPLCALMHTHLGRRKKDEYEMHLCAIFVFSLTHPCGFITVNVQIMVP